MKKALVSLILISLLALPAMASADVWDDWFGVGERPRDVVPESNVMDTLENIADWLFTILLVVAVIFIVVAAFFFVTAAGDPDKTNKARNFVLYALIGVIVAVGARGLVALARKMVIGEWGIF